MDPQGAVDSRCFYCKTDGGDVTTRQCTYADDCPGNVNVCARCVAIHKKVVCSACWLQHWGKRCYNCNEKTPRGCEAEMDFGKFCWKCGRLHSNEGRQAALRAEAQAYEDARNSRDETPTGDEPALQGLLNWLPGDPSAAPLPAYSETPEPLDPDHCRLCLAPCPAVPGGSPTASSPSAMCGISPRVAAHLRVAHPGVTDEDYRRRSVGDAVAQWPQPIPAQLDRCRVQAYSEGYPRDKFGTCACCARAKRGSKMRNVISPPPRC